MPSASSDDRNTLLPEGRRWGRGASSIVPYLYVSLLVKPFTRGPDEDGDFIRNPVFPHMEQTLRMLRRGH
jgi:hypothetical protein